MNKAFTLIEVVIVLSILPVVMLVLSRIMTTFVRDVPHGMAVVNEQTTVLNMIDAIGDDVYRAVALPDSLGARQSDDRTLLIALSNGVVAYEQADGGVSRTVLGQDGRDDPNAQRQWRLPNAVIGWQRWKQAEAAHAVEVHSYVKQTVDGHPQKKLAQTRVYLLNALGKVREVE
jgi:prepilin-type N-terminal cleavage/methylation domain-containing protein